MLREVFGDDGKLARDLLDMNNEKTPIGQLRGTIESYFVGKDSELYGLLDPKTLRFAHCTFEKRNHG